MLRTTWVIAWRYFTGLHMDGKQRSFGHGSVLPRYSGYFWNRYSRKRRALIRQIVFWVLLATAYGLLFDRQLTVYAMLAFLPFTVYLAGRKAVDALTQVVKYQDSDGVTERYRILRPKIVAWFKRYKPAKIRVSLPDGGAVPAEVARSVQAINAEDGGEPILNMRIAKELESESAPRSERKASRRVGRNPYRRTS